MVKIKKTQINATCLAHQKTLSSGNYRLPGIVKMIKADFKNKCYICECHEPTSINVEHFKPHLQRNPDLKFDWNNLFWACAHCNGIKSKNYTNILNCTDDNDNVELSIDYDIDVFPKARPKFLAIQQTPQVIETVELLDKVFNLDQPVLRSIECQNLRSALVKEMLKFQKLLCDYYRYLELDDQNELMAEIKLELMTSAPFAAFKRWKIRHNAGLCEEFGHLLNS